MARLTSLFTSVFLFVLLPLVAEEGPPARDQGLWQTLIMIAIFLGFFYLILFRPEQKRRRAAEEQRNSLKKGDRVVAMGIIGTVVRVQDDTVVLKMVDDNKIEVVKGAVTEVLSNESSKTDTKADAKADKEEAKKS